MIELLYFILVMNFLLIIITAITLYNVVKVYTELSIKLDKIDTTDEDFVDNGYIYSLDFNMKLDAMIKPLLDKYSDYDIINNVYSRLVTSDPVCKKMENRQELKNYLEEVLKSYDNYYQEDATNIPIKPIDEQYSPDRKKVTDLFNTLQNFYKD